MTIVIIINADVDENKSTLEWNIARHFYLSCLSPVVDSTLDRTLLDMHCKNHISKGGCV